MKDPHVLVLTHSLSGIDGVGRYGVATLRYLAPVCRSVTVFIGRRHRGYADDLVRSDVSLHPVLPIDHFPFLSLPKLAWLLLYSLPSLVRAARRAHIVHSFSDYPLGFVAVLVGKLANRPVVVSGHGTYSVTPLTMRGHDRLIRWMYAHVDRFLMGAAFALGRVRRLIEVPRAEVVPYGCVPADHDERAAGGVAADVPGPFVLCVGEVKQRKGYETSVPVFLETWRTRPHIHYVIVGRYAEDDPYYRDLLERIDEAGAREHVHFLGNVDERRKVALMRAARAFLLTPMTSAEGGFEAFGLVFLEAGAAGRPVVGVVDSGAEDAITDGENGYLGVREDIMGLADGLGRLFDDQALADRMGAVGRRRAEVQTWQRAAARVRAVYGELLGAEFVRGQVESVS